MKTLESSTDFPSGDAIAVCPVDALPPNHRRIVRVGGVELGIFNIAGEYYAIGNRCPHRGAPLCAGTVCGTTRPGPVGEFHWHREGEIIRCPWHGWEFDIKTGKSVFDAHRVRAQSYLAEARGDWVVVHLLPITSSPTELSA